MKPYDVTPEQIECFRRERTQFRLLYRCPDCDHFSERSGRCSLFFPNRTLIEAENYLQQDGQFVFCKYFEIG